MTHIEIQQQKPSFKEGFFRAIVKARIPIMIAFAICAVLCLLASRLVGVNYDMTDYLPEDTASTRAIELMSEEFSGDTPNARVMVEGISIAEALDIKAQIAQIDGVTDVMWLDDVVSLSTPLELQGGSAASYYRDETALFSVTIEDNMRQTAVTDIRAIVGEEAAMAGSAVSTAIATESTVVEVGIVTAVAIIFILLILLLTTRTWIEPILVLIGLGVAVAINNGTNLIFGDISFVTDAAGSILQVAIALDFSVFLLHRYRECRGTTASAEEDMVQALCKCSNAVFSSGCTVMIGFLALTVMQFQIGPDLGFALAKGIAISLITVFTFTPGLFVLCEKLIARTEHRSFLPSMGGFAKAVSYVCIPLAVVFVLLPIPAHMASTSDEVTHYYGSSFIYGPGTELGDDTERIQEVFGKTDTYVLMVPCGDIASEKALSNALHEIPQVTGIISYVDMASAAIPTSMVGESTLSLLQSDEYSRMVITVDALYEGAATFALVDLVRDTAEAHYPGEWYLAGDGVSTTDLMLTITEDKDLVDMIAIIAVLIVLLLATRSLTLPFILVFVIETSIWCNFAYPYFSNTPEFYLSYLIVSAIQLGVTVDYAILLNDRYLESRRVMPKRQAVRETVERVVVPIMTSGIVLVVVGIAMSTVSSHGILAQLGHFLGVGVLLSLVAVIFVLPGFLYIFDGLIERTTWRARFVKDDAR